MTDQTGESQWAGKRTLGFRKMPDDVLTRFEQVLPTMPGFSRRTAIGLLSVWTCDSMPESVRRRLLDWVEAATADPSLRDDPDLAVRFATWILEAQSDD